MTHFSIACERSKYILANVCGVEFTYIIYFVSKGIMSQRRNALLQTALVALLFISSNECSVPTVNKYKVHFDKVYTGSEIVSKIQTRSIPECTIYCAANENCRSISWRKDPPGRLVCLPIAKKLR